MKSPASWRGFFIEGKYLQLFFLISDKDLVYHRNLWIQLATQS